MENCRWCRTLTDRTIILEVVKAKISTNERGNFKRTIKAARSVACCERCKARIEAKDESTIDVVHQMDIYEAIKEME